jgi:hypothetical protein
MQRTVDIADDSFEAMQRLAAERVGETACRWSRPTESRVEAMLAGAIPITSSA